MHQLVTFELV
jgi:hypothetical protein